MLVMERTEKREVREASAELQLTLIELSPLEEAWENVLDVLCQQVGESTVNSWLKPLQLGDLADGTLTYRAKTKFVADWVESHYGSRLRTAWQSIGYEIAAVRIESARRKSAA